MKKLIRFTIVVGQIVFLMMGVTSLAYADHQDFEAKLSGAQQVTEVVSPGRGRVDVRFNNAFKQVSVDVRINDLEGAFTAAHFHCARPGENGPVAFGLVMPGPLALDENRIRGVLTNADFTGSDCTAAVGRPVNNIAALAFAMRDGLIYLNVHTDSVPSGELRGQLLEKDDNDDVVPSGSAQ